MLAEVIVPIIWKPDSEHAGCGRVSHESNAVDIFECLIFLAESDDLLSSELETPWEMSAADKERGNDEDENELNSEERHI